MSENDKYGLAVLAALITAPLAFYAKVKTTAIKTLDSQGALQDIKAQGNAAVENIEHSSLSRSQKHTEIKKTEHDFRTKRASILHKNGMDTVSGAWKKMTQKDKNKCIGFAAVSSVFVGGVTALVCRASRNSGRGGDGYDGAWDGFWVGSGGHHSGGFFDHGGFFDGFGGHGF